MENKNHKWYAIFVMQNKEFHVKDRLETVFAKNPQVKSVLLPTIKEISEVRRKKIVRNLPVYSCYLFIQADLSGEIQNQISDVNFVVKILGSQENQPLAIKDQEMEIVKAVASDNRMTCAFSHKIGDVIEILGGHCKGLSGRIIDIIDINSIKVEIQIFNRAIYTIIKVEDIKIA